ncbi:MAG: hypothetical protein PF588_07155 [Candidatus Kapabacteria bacterium]|jgi:hypothetical protein|nr:hypothetical protein [Candidatus Kapabacteria bacterium]
MKNIKTYISILVIASLSLALSSCGESFGIEANAKTTFENPNYEPVEPGMIEAEMVLKLYELIDYSSPNKYDIPIQLYSETIVISKAVIDTSGAFDMMSLELEIDRPSKYHATRKENFLCNETVEKIHLIIDNIPVESARHEYTGLSTEEHKSTISYFDYANNNRQTFPAQKYKMVYTVEYIKYYHDIKSIASYINIEVPIQDTTSYRLFFQGKIDINYSLTEE